MISIPVPELTRLGRMSKPLRPSRHRFWKTRLGNSGDLPCLDSLRSLPLAHCADGYSAADTPPSGFPAAGLWKAPLDCSFHPRAEGALTTARPPLSLVLPVLLVLFLILSCLSLRPQAAVSARVVTHSALVVQQ